MPRGRNVENGAKKLLHLEDSLDLCLRLAMKQAVRLNKKVETAGKQESLQAKGYVTSPRKEESQKSKKNISEPLCEAASAISSETVYGRYKKLKKAETSCSQKSTADCQKFCYFGAPQVIYPKGFKSSKKFVRPSISKVLSSCEKEIPKSVNSFSSDNLAPLVTSVTVCSSMKSEKSEKEEFIGRYEFPVTVKENNIDRISIAKMTASRLPDSNWLVLDIEIYDADGKTLLYLRGELLGSRARNVVING